MLDFIVIKDWQTAGMESLQVVWVGLGDPGCKSDMFIQ
jgi:hypothetical protein